MYNNESFSGIMKRFQFLYRELALNIMYQGVFQKGLQERKEILQ